VGTDGSPALSECLLEQLSEVFDVIAVAIREADDADQAFRFASQLVETIREINKNAGDVRAQAALRIKNTRSLSAARLGDRLGITKQRAYELIKAAESASSPEVTSNASSKGEGTWPNT